jgi:hypothetical protein
MSTQVGHGPIVRGCGVRKRGGIYLVVPLAKPGEGGRPLTDFIVDPPSPVDPEALGVSPVGVSLIEHGGVWHVLDWVGSDNYPNVADFIEEAARHGISRRLSQSFDFAKITSASRLLLIHGRGTIDDPTPYYEGIDGDTYPCITRHADHLINPPTEMCATVWWNDLDGGIPYDEENARLVRRTIGDTTYFARATPFHASPVYRPAIFMSTPIPQLEIVKDMQNFTHEHAYEVASTAGVDVSFVDH